MKRDVLYVVSSTNNILAHSRKLLLDRAGYSTTVATDTQAALAALQEQRVDVVLVGSSTGGMDLERVLWSVRTQQHDIPVVKLTANPAGRPEVIEVEPLAGPGVLLHALGRAMTSAHGHFVDESECVMFVDSDRRYFHVTQSAAELLGYGDGELIGRRIDDIAAPEMDVGAKFESYVRDGKQHGVFTLRHRDGSPVRVRYAAEVLSDGCMVSHLTPY